VTPSERIRPVNAAPVRPERAYVLYWMIAARRLGWSFALDRAVERARALGKPLVVLEALRTGYPYASDRIHAFVLAGMAENGRRAAGRVLHHPYVERAEGEGKGLVEALARHACAVVTDDFPTFFLPRMVEAAGARLDVRLEAVDGSGLVPFRLAGEAFPTAYAFRRFLQRQLPRWLESFPSPDPLAGAGLPRLAALPPEVARRWPAADLADLARPARLLATLPIDHTVTPVAAVQGGAAAAEGRLAAFVALGLPRYGERNHPDADATSGLSPFLHFGHLSAHEVARAVLSREGFEPSRLHPEAKGARAGFWGLSPEAEAFLDQLVTWRELGFNACAHDPQHRELASLPPWARATLAKHARDPRPALYSEEDLAAGRTGDPIWNAAQRQLREEGVVHNYLRMIWGKRLVEWRSSPEDALRVALDLNDRWALDGRDPNSVTGVLWSFGKHDRPWGPERPVYGTVRYMSSALTPKKLRMERWLARFGGEVRPRGAAAQGTLPLGPSDP
jgi:deoxyribodipyrimidine photo-lyase